MAWHLEKELQEGSPDRGVSKHTCTLFFYVCSREILEAFSALDGVWKGFIYKGCTVGIPYFPKHQCLRAETFFAQLLVSYVQFTVALH